MVELKNTFSWSFSAANDFSECRRRRYWDKYAKWGGWEGNAGALQRAAYRLSKMENLFSVSGNAVEKAVMWVLRQSQQGREVTADQAYEAEARPYLNRCWTESRKRMWEVHPKKYCCLREHYYGQLDEAAQKDLVARMIEQIKLCTGNFIRSVLPRLAGVKPEQEIHVATVATGDPESFVFEEVKIYAIPDYVYGVEGGLEIHDWKSGGQREKHHDQMALYTLWANAKYRFPPEKVRTHIEYLATGEVVNAAVTQANIESACERIRYSVGEMAEYLVDGDLRRNEPLPQADWELAADPAVCGTCDFYELCKPELDAS